MANQQLHQSNLILRVNRAKKTGLPNEQIIKLAKAENALQGCAMADRNLPLSTNVDTSNISTFMQKTKDLEGAIKRIAFQKVANDNPQATISKNNQSSKQDTDIRVIGQVLTQTNPKKLHLAVSNVFRSKIPKVLAKSQSDVVIPDGSGPILEEIITNQAMKTKFLGFGVKSQLQKGKINENEEISSSYEKIKGHTKQFLTNKDENSMIIIKNGEIFKKKVLEQEKDDPERSRLL